MRIRKFATSQELRSAIKELHKECPNTWLHLSNAAVDACFNDGALVGIKHTEADEWNLLDRLKIEGEDYKFDVKHPNKVLFFDMA